VSGLWTPSGEHVPEPEPTGSPAGPGPTAPAGPGGPGAGGPGGGEEEIDDAVLAEELRRVREELARTPVADIIANHAVGLWQLAVLHLSPEEGQQPNLAEAGLAIDAMAGLVEGLGDRLGPHAEALRDALAQLRVAFVQVRDHAGDA
jgi:hypothetical protein